MGDKNKKQDVQEEDENKQPKEEVVVKDDETIVKKPEEAVEEPVQKTEPKVEEQLSILKEVRGELANAYKSHKEQVKTIEQLNKSVESLSKEQKENTKTVENLQAELGIFKAREKEATAVAKVKRIEELSLAFEALGQPKSVEHLSKLSNDVIGEFEQVTSMALGKKSEEQLSMVTIPTRALPNSKKPLQEQPKKVEQLSFGQICSSLTEQQNRNGSDAKRVINM